MEHSSPLAAMQPPSMLFGHCFRADAPTSYPSLSGFGTNSFNFKDLSMKKAGPDYFNIKPIPSPTASLAADLSQNFHIDQSPQLATPRRSLFSSNILAQANARDDVMTTPPLPSSSPAPAMDMMEMSPLPHKPAFVMTTEIEVHSPSPLGTPMDSPTTSAAETPSSVPSPQPGQEQGSVLPAGNGSTHSREQSTPFRFSTAGAKTSLSTSTSLEDMFGDSPPQERSISRNNSSNNLALPRLRPPFQHARSSGSPAPNSIRKPSHPLTRPRKQCRRSLSMFEHPADVIAEKEAKVSTNAPLQSISDLESSPIPQLPHFVPEDRADTLPRIDKSTLLELLHGKFNDRFDNIMVVDCRFEYEYDGGHIHGALNYNDKDRLAGELFGAPKARTALILHCEYSAHRAPIMAKYIRHHDRAVNVDSYPNLTYPDLYILDGGYSSFFAEHRAFCYPQNYVEMNANGHEFACERGLGKVKQRSKLNRAQTFAFGQHSSPQMEDSPTGRCRLGSDRNSRLLGSPFSESPVPNRTPGRRMLSY
ncbi:M-phase inducer phosphatase [Penicillium canariense]|uniref:M-phase inducer phosphatase n=1 Tax=Penicillium canariense TaxID=189055 RepID=A0A9W9I0E0_9EURO|nr:M-phase inducer phosphatase [Penicillium canariense]KAJ5160797.1 M-phase inducer phosphatase [Penicillium canariense]